MTSFVHAKHPPLINLIISIKLAVYNSKSFKPNKSASPFRKKDLATFKSFHPTSSIAQSSACCSPCQNLHNGKNELAGRTPTKGSNCRTPTSATTHAPTSAVSPVVAPLVASRSANSSMVRYLEDDFQRIFRTILDFRSLAPVFAPVVAALCIIKTHVSSLWKLGS